MGLKIMPSGQACGATVTGVDLTAPLNETTIAEIRAAWLEHLVLSFPDQAMSDDDLERFTLYFGPFGHDPYIAPIEGRDHIIAVKRLADETSPIFAETWHSDWSFQAVPPAGTCLFGITIPPHGGDTLFANQQKAWDDMPDEMKAKFADKKAIHSAALGYSKGGLYGENDADDRSMDILHSDAALATHTHDLIRKHPETGRDAIFSSVAYITGFENVPIEASRALLIELYNWQTRPEFQYRHKWQPNMLIMWDNRSLVHMATGGYAGHDRLLHRTTIGERIAA
ncbi:MAG: TauD/TfdA family dioxygenase [Pseudomonadota bacterium]